MRHHELERLRFDRELQAVVGDQLAVDVEAGDRRRSLFDLDRCGRWR